MVTIISLRALKWLVILHIIFQSKRSATAQQSAAGQDTLIAIVGRDYVMMGADSSSSGGGGIALTSSNIDKLAVIHDGGYSGEGFGNDAIDALRQQAIVAGLAGDAADADRLIGILRTHAQTQEFEAGIGNDAVCVFDGQSRHSRSKAMIQTNPTAGLDSEAIAYLARSEISSRLRTRQPLQLCLLVAGMVRCNEPRVSSTLNIQGKQPSLFSERVQNQVIVGSQTYSAKSNGTELIQKDQCTAKPSTNYEHRSGFNHLLVPKLFWLDQYGSMQQLKYGAHGFGSNFALSVLDQRYRNDLTRDEAFDLIQECFLQLRQRYVINSPAKPRIKCVDLLGVREVRNLPEEAK